jgi:hypothetical protein
LIKGYNMARIILAHKKCVMVGKGTIGIAPRVVETYTEDGFTNLTVRRYDMRIRTRITI